MVSPLFYCLMPCESVGSAAPLAPACLQSPLRGCRCCSPWCLGWLGSFRPLPVPVFLPPSLCFPQGSLWRFHPPRKLFDSGGVGAPRRIDSPSHLLAIPPGVVFRHPRGLMTLSLHPTQENLPARFSRRLETLSLFFSTPWRPPAPAASASPEVATEVAPQLATAPPGLSSTPLPSDYSDVAVRVFLPARNPLTFFF